MSIFRVGHRAVQAGGGVLPVFLPAGDVGAETGYVEELRLVRQFLEKVEVLLPKRVKPDKTVPQIVQDETVTKKKKKGQKTRIMSHLVMVVKNIFIKNKMSKKQNKNTNSRVHGTTVKKDRSAPRLKRGGR